MSRLTKPIKYPIVVEGASKDDSREDRLHVLGLRHPCPNEH